MLTRLQPSHSSSPRRQRRPRQAIFLLGAVVVASFLSVTSTRAAAQRSPVESRALSAIAANHAVDAGVVPSSQMITLHLRLAQTPTQTAALDQLLAAQQDITSLSYRHWLTPAAFATSFGLPDAQLQQLIDWFTAQGLTVTAISPARTRLSITGTAAQVQAAFAADLHRVSASGNLYFASTTAPTVPAAIASLVVGISGLDDLPSVASDRITLGTAASGLTATAHLATAGAAVPTTEAGMDPLAALSALVDANNAPVATLTSTACVSELSPAEIDDFRDVLRQAAAQGITVVSTSACSGVGTTSVPAFPAALGEVLAITLAPTANTVAASTGLEDRPSWQAATGLPADRLRHEPDLTTPSAAAFEQTVLAINKEVGTRIGSMNATLYALAKSPGLFVQAATSATDTATPTTQGAAGTWTTSSGLGTVNLAKLIKAYPRATVNSTTVGIQSSAYAINYGDSFTLTAKVLPNSYANSGPTGTVTFSASSQGTIGSVAIDGTGTATLTPDVLPVGVYAITATYSGDGSYTGSASNKTTITISIVNARLTASIAPAINVPYGATATVTATVSLPGANAAPSGPVSAQIQGVTGALYTATLSPNPGGNSATANIVVSVPQPNTALYTVEVTCLGDTNFQCQTPADLKLQSVKGYTNTTVSVTPAAPQAGQPVTLTATLANAGNGTGSYVYNGSVSFYDSGKLLATSPVATNQATISLALSGNRTHNIIAVYTGDANWNTSTSGAAAVTPTILPDDLTLTSNVTSTSPLAGANIIFTATSTTTITYGTGPTGSVSFFDTFNGAVVQIGSAAPLVANGTTASIALVSTTGLLPGTHRIYAQYSGDNNYASSISPVLVLPLSDFSVTMTPTVLSLAQGSSQAVTVFVGGSGGFAGNVSLSCTPPPSSLATCAFAPATLSAGNATVFTITTTAATPLAKNAAPAGFWTASTGVFVAALFFVAVPNRRRTLPALLSILFAAGLLSANLGCGLGMTVANGSSSGSTSGSGSGTSTPTVTNGTPLGTQNFVITAAGTDGTNTIRHTYQYQVTVQ